MDPYKPQVAANDRGNGVTKDRRREMLYVRPYTPNDLTFTLSLAPRLAIGKQPWRDLQALRVRVLRVHTAPG